MLLLFRTFGVLLTLQHNLGARTNTRNSEINKPFFEAAHPKDISFFTVYDRLSQLSPSTL
jgi:hypothetical protein